MTWQKLLKGSQTEVLSRIFSVLPFHELPYGQMKVEDWSQAHVPSVLWLLYRGLPDGKRKDKGKDALLDEWKKHELKSLEAADHMKQGCGFDVTTETCHVLPEIEPLEMSSWEEATLYKVLYNVLDKNDVLKGNTESKASLW